MQSHFYSSVWFYCHINRVESIKENMILTLKNIEFTISKEPPDVYFSRALPQAQL